ncbi:unnamed protein product [Mytilus coruscus]|uniref:C3H1-type domain-containing protein n=1 Tax=Mytilus coruscus TaxID=42192 RepID=A0A6J8D4J2_MYTCO|nr:unnamed protein product [Mytilus coruscus]
MVLQQKQQQQKITNIDQWTDAFLVFISVYCLAHPEKFQELLKYTNNIRIAAKRCGSYSIGWKQYDEQFRLKISQNPTASWADIDLELWLMYISQNNNATESTVRSIYKCYAFNYNGSCTRFNCTYSHSCIRCFAAHPLVSCPRGMVNKYQGKMLGGTRPAFIARPRLQLRPQDNYSFRTHSCIQDQEIKDQLWVKGHTPVKVHVLEKYLTNYYNRHDAELLFTGFRDGFRLNYVGPRLSVWSKNLISAEMHKNETKMKLTEEVELGRMLGPFTEKPISTLRISPIGLVQ